MRTHDQLVAKLMRRPGVRKEVELALSTGALSPYTEPQAQFVLVALQRAPAETRHEVAWIWLINLMRIALLVEQSTSPTSRAKAFLYEKAVDAAATLRRFIG